MAIVGHIPLMKSLVSRVAATISTVVSLGTY